MDLLFDKSPRKHRLAVYSSESRFIFVLEGALSCAHLVNICQEPYREVPHPNKLFQYFDNLDEISALEKELTCLSSITIKAEQADALAAIFKKGCVYQAEYLFPTRSEYLSALFQNHADSLRDVYDALSQVLKTPETTSCCGIL